MWSWSWNTGGSCHLFVDKADEHTMWDVDTNAAYDQSVAWESAGHVAIVLLVTRTWKSEHAVRYSSRSSWERERESSFLTAHQHIIGYSVPWRGREWDEIAWSMLLHRRLWDVSYTSFDVHIASLTRGLYSLLEYHILVQEGLAVANIARDDPSTLLGDNPFPRARMHRDRIAR